MRAHGSRTLPAVKFRPNFTKSAAPVSHDLKSIVWVPDPTPNNVIAAGQNHVWALMVSGFIFQGFRFRIMISCLDVARHRWPLLCFFVAVGYENRKASGWQEL